MKAILKTLALWLAAAVLAVCVALLTVFYFPSILIRPSTLPTAVRLLEQAGVPLQYASASWRAESVSPLRKRLTLNLEQFCAPNAQSSDRVCAKNAHLVLLVDLGRLHLQIEKLAVTALEIHTVATKSEAGANRPEETLSLPSWLSRIGWTDMEADWSLQYRDGGDVLVLAGKLQGKQDTLQAQASAAYSAGKTTSHYSAEITAARSGGSIEGKVSATAQDPSDGIRQASFESGSYRLTFGSEPHLKLEGTVGATTSRPSSKIDPIELRADLSAEARQTGRSGWVLSHASLRPRAENLGLEGKLSVAEPMGTGDDLAGDLIGNWDFQIQDFSRVVERLKQSPFAIPAPLNELGGTILFKGNATLQGLAGTVRSEWTLTPELKSDHQNVQIAASGSFGITGLRAEPKAELKADVVVHSSSLLLPHIEITHFPRFFPDPQIVYRQLASTPSGFEFVYDIRIHTAEGEHFGLRSSQLNTEVPVEIDLRVNSENGLTGKLAVRSFPVHFFRRNAEVKRVVVRFPKTGAPELSARVQINYADYALTLLGEGKLNEPRFTIASNPPLSQNSAYALLLFGRPLEDLSPGQSESVASAQAAVAGGAVSALSMYLLASTPVESIGYEPANGRFLATVRVAEGTSLRVESQKEGLSMVGVRQRLGRDWVISTDVRRDPTSDDRRSVSTYLEWTKTY
ncbi:translocation/assembly module TamB [bacterium]|nr:translocation/assembly module TamB [bacterium]